MHKHIKLSIPAPVP